METIDRHDAWKASPRVARCDPVFNDKLALLTVSEDKEVLRFFCRIRFVVPPRWPIFAFACYDGVPCLASARSKACLKLKE